ncbi:MAG: mannitol dehydrogenase family protein [Thalassovita sp.]
MTHTPVLQFGTSRFLQAHADLFISEASHAGQDAGSITVVQSSGDRARAERLAALSSGYIVRIEGLENNQAVSRETRVTSVARTLSTANDWDAVVDVFCNQAEFVLSNTGDTGFEASLVDEADSFEQSMSYPAKLTLLLWARFQNGARPIQIMPMELIVDNGQVLKTRVLELANRFGEAFVAYVMNDVLWANSLVDRIVSEPLEPAGAVAEPYALWAVEAQEGLRLPCDHPSIQVVPALEAIESLKLFVLNLGHTYLANCWIVAGRDPNVMVRDMVNDPAQRSALLALYQYEVRPAFVAAGQAKAFDAYVAVTLERFGNPYLAHKLADIAQNHQAKIERRITAFLTWAERHADASPKPVLQSLSTTFEGAA